MPPWKPTSAPVAQRGDLWRLGDHRLLCGDATDASDVSRFLAKGRRRWPSPTLPTTSRWGITAASSGAAGGAHRRTMPSRLSVGGLLPGLGTQPAGPRRRRPVRLHVHQGVAHRLPGPRRGGRPLVGHHHLGQGPLRPWPGRLPAAVRADLVRLAGGSRHHWCGDRDQGDVWAIARPADRSSTPP